MSVSMSVSFQVLCALALFMRSFQKRSENSLAQQIKLLYYLTTYVVCVYIYIVIYTVYKIRIKIGYQGLFQQCHERSSLQLRKSNWNQPPVGVTPALTMHSLDPFGPSVPLGALTSRACPPCLAPPTKGGNWER